MPDWNRVSRIVLQSALLLVLVRAEEVFNTTPPPVRTNFSCAGRATGFYADVEANCRVYHTCDDFGNKFSYRCPEETAFRQDALICDHAHLVDCKATEYSGQRAGNEKRENPGTTTPLSFGTLSLGNNRRSFSRSFQVIQRPNKSAVSNKPGFVFSASVFLRDLHEPETEKLQPPVRDKSVNSQSAKSAGDTCNINGMHIKENLRTSSTVRPPFRPFSSKLFEDRPADARQEVSTTRQMGPRVRDKVQIGTSSYKDSAEPHRPTLFYSRKQDAPKPDTLGKDPSDQKEVPTSTPGYQPATRNFASRDFTKLSYSNRDYPYLETLRSIQANARTPTATATTTPRTMTTEVPVYALTLSLKPLVPNELEYDPYYPRFPTSTEAYYTPSHGDRRLNFRTSTEASWTSVHFEIPAVLPDLNTLEDLVDRRKLFYIPRVKST